MRKITKQACGAFVNREPYNNSNTMVTVAMKTNTASMYLHGNRIAMLSNNVLTLSSCGWETNTTKERLNGLLAQYNMGSIRQVKGVWYYIRRDDSKKLFEDGMEIKL